MRLAVTPKTNQQATLKVLAGSDIISPALVLSFSAKQLRVSVEAKLPPGTLVQVRGENWTVLGEVAAFENGTPAEAMIDVEHLAANTTELERSGEAWFR